jgi:hypothetical protein
MRFLRIGFSVLCGIVAVLLVLLWVRSYWWADFVYGHVTEVHFLDLNSNCGRLALSLQGELHNPIHWKVYSHPSEQLDWMMGPSKWEFGKSKFGDMWFVAIPHWFLITIFGAFSAAPWLRLNNRFSLRTLLIAITLAGLLLGLIIATTR